MSEVQKLDLEYRKEMGKISDFENVADLGHDRNSQSAVVSSVCICKSHSALPRVCIGLIQNNKKTDPLFSSPYPTLPSSSSSSSSLLLGQTDKWNTQRVWS